MQAARPPRRERLASVSGGHRGPRGPRQRNKAAKPRRECPNCKSTDLQEHEGNLVCGECGNTIDDSNIVAEVTFGETSAGAAVVQGGTIGEGARHATTLGPAFRRAGGGMESREVTEQAGRDEIRRQANNLNLSDNIADQAFSIYKLACNANFIQGRRVNAVASCCLYVCCRRDKNTTVMLIDFSEAISVNVYRLGQTYADLKKTLMLPDSNALGHRPVIDVAALIYKFARKLEFGSMLEKVSEDACKIIRRMNRDWMVTGRRPAGLCGACIILAARMNNFRRTVREVVYVVKVADMTVAKRLEEFSRTRASDLSVEQFREYGERLKISHDPPALYEAKLKAEKKAKKRKRAEMLDGDGEEAPVQDSRSPSGTPTPAPEDTQASRIDADGFAIPALPIDPNLNDVTVDGVVESQPDNGEGSSEPAKKKRGRPRGAQPLPTITEADLLAEGELEEEMEGILNDPSSLASMEDAAFNEVADRAKELAESLRNPTAAVPAAIVSDDPEIGEDEFENDPEVRNCLLTEAERKIKERIWVTYNEDWLRAKQAKELKKALDEANGVAGKPKRKRSTKGRMGDGSVLEGGTPVEDAADANQRMLERRAKTFSKHINYDKLNKFYANLRSEKGGPGTTTDTTTEADTLSVISEDTPATELSGKRGQAVVGAKGGMLPTPAATQEVGGKGDDDDENIEVNPELGFNAADWEEEDDEEDEGPVDEADALHEAGIDVGDDDDYGAYYEAGGDGGYEDDE